MSWLGKYNGLTYSQSLGGGFCLFCVLFGQCEPSVKELGVLVNRPLPNFKNAIEKLTEHFVSKGRKSHRQFGKSNSIFSCERESSCFY